MKVDETTLRQLCESGKTAAEAADHFCISYSAIFYYCRKYGVTFRGNQKKPAQPAHDSEVKVKVNVEKIQTQNSDDPPDRLDNLYKQVTEIRFHMRRLAHKERKLLDLITQTLDGKDQAD